MYASTTRVSSPAEKGLTLIELIILIAIIGIVVAAATPSMRSLIDNNRLSGAVNDLVGAAHYAKSQAVFENRDVSLDINTCPAEHVWTVSNSEGVLKQGERCTERLQVAGPASVVFTPDGVPNAGASWTLSLQDSGVAARVVEIGVAGSISSRKRTP